MTTYYISTAGNDSNNGLSPDATTANTNKPWLTLAKAMNTGSTVVPGDIVYIGPGIYYSSSVTPIAGIASVASPTQFIGDPNNAQGFKNSSGVLLAAGLPWLTTRTSGEGLDSEIASSLSLFIASTNKPSGLQFKFLALETSHTNVGATWLFNAALGTDTLFEDCFASGFQFASYVGTGAPTAGMNLTVRRCTLLTRDIFDMRTTTAAATANANMGILVEENLVFGAFCVVAAAWGASGGNIAGGVNIFDNTFICTSGAFIATTALRVSTTNPVHYGGNLILFPGMSGGTIAGTAGQIIDDGYNRHLQRGTNTNVTLAGTSIIGIAPNLVLPFLSTWGLEMPRSDLFGWTDAAHTNQKFSAHARTTSDFRGRTVRPWGAGSSIGCWQVQPVALDTGSAITGGGVNSLKLTGAGEVSLYIPVDATGATISVTTKSTSYGGTNWPQMVVVANPGVGVTSDTTVTASSASEQTITTGTITPTSKGVMEVRLISRSSSGSSLTYFDLLTSP